MIPVFACKSHPTAIGICPVVVKPIDDVKRGKLCAQALKPERGEVIWLRKDMQCDQYLVVRDQARTSKGQLVRRC